MQIPTLNIWFRKYKNGVPVRGHAARCYSIATEWRRRGGKVKYFPETFLAQSVSLIDGKWDSNAISYLTDLRVIITDSPEEGSRVGDILVSPAPGSEFEDWNFNGTKLLGPKYFPRRPEYDECGSVYGGYIAIVPGGNKESFFEQMNLPKNHRYIIVDGYSPSMSATIISKATAILCSASTVAMEAMSLGKPTCIVKTSEDQELIYKWLPHLGAFYYDENLLDYVMDDEEYRLFFTYRSQLSIPSDGAKNLVDAILEEWKRSNDSYRSRDRL